MTDQRVTLPERDEMLRRLKSVIDEPHTTENFYPKLLKHAGQAKTGVGVGLMFQLAVFDYAGETGPVAAGLNVAAPSFMAVLVEDEDIRRYALWTLGFEAKPETCTEERPS
jgi:hypothetical protein